jgi:hypothetical protein
VGKIKMDQQNANLKQDNYSFVDFLLYFGGFSLFLGIYYFVVNFWESMGSFLQIFFTLIVSLILLVLGVFLNQKLKLSKLGSPLIFISYFLLPLGVYVLATKIYPNPILNENYIATLLVSSIVFSLVHQILNSNLSLFFSMTYFFIFYFLYVFYISYDYVNGPDDLFLNNIFTSSLVFIGISGHFLARYLRDSRIHFYYFVNLISINLGLLGLWFFNFFLKPNYLSYLIWLAIFPLTLLGLIYYSRKASDLLLKIFASIYLVFYIFYLIFKNITSEYLVPTILVLLGLILMGGGYYYYLKKTIINRNSIN